MGALRRQWERDLARFRPAPDGRAGQHIGAWVGLAIIVVGVVTLVLSLQSR